MPDSLLPVIIVACLVLSILWTIRCRVVAARTYRNSTIVEEGKEYPNNYHVLGVGYYHATDRRWHTSPWNEFREAWGYYWDGEWHTDPDTRQIVSSVPHPAEIARVNEDWRRAGPGKAASFWADVAQFGFGTAIGRRQGS